jgi:DNA-binding MarR family transcriptional regulator
MHVVSDIFFVLSYDNFNFNVSMQMKKWSFLTNHGLILIYISKHPQCTTRQIALAINITERTVHRILQDLEVEGYITRERTGKGNIYQINSELKLRHELTEALQVGDLLQLLSGKAPG